MKLQTIRNRPMTPSTIVKAASLLGIYQTRGGSGSNLPDPDDTDGDDEGTSGASKSCMEITAIFVFTIAIAIWDSYVKKVENCFDKGLFQGLVCLVVGLILVIVLTIVLLVVFTAVTIHICGTTPPGSDRQNVT